MRDFIRKGISKIRKATEPDKGTRRVARVRPIWKLVGGICLMAGLVVLVFFLCGKAFGTGDAESASGTEAGLLYDSEGQGSATEVLVSDGSSEAQSEDGEMPAPPILVPDVGQVTEEGTLMEEANLTEKEEDEESNAASTSEDATGSSPASASSEETTSVHYEEGWVYTGSKVADDISQEWKEYLDTYVWEWIAYEHTDDELIQTMRSFYYSVRTENMSCTICERGGRYLYRGDKELPDFSLNLTQSQNLEYYFVGVYTKGEYQDGYLVVYFYEAGAM